MPRPCLRMPHQFAHARRANFPTHAAPRPCTRTAAPRVEDQLAVSRRDPSRPLSLEVCARAPSHRVSRDWRARPLVTPLMIVRL